MERPDSNGSAHSWGVKNMATAQSESQVGAEDAALDAEVLIIGAGVTGIYQLYLLRIKYFLATDSFSKSLRVT